MRVKKRIGILFVLLAMTACVATSATAIDNLMALQGTANDGSPINNGDLTVTIWNQSAGGALLYNSSTDFDGAITSGQYDVLLGEFTQLSLEYGNYYYLDLSINGQDLDFNGSERRIFQSGVGPVGAQFIKAGAVGTSQLADSSVTAQKLSFATFATGCIAGEYSRFNGSSFICAADQQGSGSDGTGGWTNTSINTTTSLAVIVSNNITASNFFGSLNWSSLLSVPSYVKDWANEIASLNTTKLNITDQRFNDTASINSASSALQSNITLVDARATSLNTSKLNATDQRYNETAAINTASANLQSNITLADARSTSLNATKANVSHSHQAGDITSGSFPNVRIGTAAVNNNSLNVTNQGTAGQILSLGSNGQFTWADDGSGTGVKEFFTRKTYYREAMFESVTSGYNEPWIGTAISAGTTALVAGTYSHPGTASMSTSTTASSGYSWQITGATTYLLGPDYTTTATFKPIAKSGNVTQIRFGFMDSFTATLPTDGAYCNITQINATTFTAVGQARNNNAMTTTASNYNMTNNTWYSCTVYIVSSSLARFTIANETADLWTDTVASNIPTATGRETSNAFLAYTSGGTTAQIVANIDYITVGINATVSR